MTSAAPPTAHPRPTLPDRRRWGRRALNAIDERLGIDALRYPVPEHGNNLAWSLGGLTAITLMVLIVTGVVLAQFYNPTPEVANHSVRHIVQDVFLGRFIRGVHYWGAQAMFVLAALHLLRVFFHGSYKRPREANWLIGVAMLALTIGAIFTGTVLKWDQEGYEALGHNLEIAKLLGGAGFWFSSDFSSHTPILVRLYTAHVVLIPGMILALLGVHALLIKRHKISPHPALIAAAQKAHRSDAAPTTAPTVAAPDEPTEPFTAHLRRLVAFGMMSLALLSVLAVLFPPGVGPTPVAGIEVTKPPMLFWWLFTLENWIGLPGILWGAGVLFAILAAVPFIDRNPQRSWRQRPIAMALAAAILITLVVLTILMAVTKPAQHLM
jgi:ubiquinol-cytochrome c reductase cytochrome b subunit